VKLQDGLGNQLFQYAVARSLAIRRSTDVLLDTRSYTWQVLRTYGLDNFNIQARKGSKLQIAPYQFKVQHYRKKLFGSYSSRYIKEKSTRFDPSVLDLPDHVYLVGYFQSEQYFSDIAGTIREDFKLKDELPSHLLDIKKQMKSCNSVSIHVRRGDFVHLGLHVLPVEYYVRAIGRLRSELSDPVFFVFSDDPEWSKDNLPKGSSYIYVSDGKTRDFQELSLISHCLHHIIANSTFSWWGAWLNPDTEKKVIAPSVWFTHNPELDATDIIPKSWSIM
jgi:hypothetical protein